MDDLEEDPLLRQNVNIYKDPKNINLPVDIDDADDPNAPGITLEEMLDDLQIEDDPMEGDEDEGGEYMPWWEKVIKCKTMLHYQRTVTICLE